MSIPNNSPFHFVVSPGTRDHRGFFVQDGTYDLLRVEESGWAFICLDNHVCYYVDPENVLEVCPLDED
ncbi:MAG: hypothetical protein O3C67_04770 [Cyanobacteria bacterium]|nr:hypothetical protein [Cyanobacteriota bacterium]